MKAKTHVAYEPDDSVTIRLTPKAIGVLVSKIPTGKLDEFFESVLAESVFMTQEHRDLLSGEIFRMENKVKKEAEVERQLDEFRNEYDQDIWEIKPYTEIRGTGGKPDRVWTIHGHTIGIEAKRVMSKTNMSSLPTVIQTRELSDLARAGGASCVVDLESVGLFLSEMVDIIENDENGFELFMESSNYVEVFNIDNWGRYPEEIQI